MDVPINFPNPVVGTTVCATIQVNDDDIIEEDETVMVTANLPSGIIIGSPSSHTITITDNER